MYSDLYDFQWFVETGLGLETMGETYNYGELSVAKSLRYYAVL